MATILARENFWTDKSRFANAERQYYESLSKMDGITNLAATPISSDVLDRISAVEKDNLELKKLIASLQKLCLESQNKIRDLESQLQKKDDKPVTGSSAPATSNGTSKPAAAAAAGGDEEDDDVDLFASDSDEENEEAARIREERLAAYAEKKSKKTAIIAKSSLVLDVKPWDDETDLKQMETEIRKIVSDGLLWGASKFVPVAFGIQKLSISCVVEDDKVSIDWLTEEIEKLEDFVQSVDIAAFNKI